MLKDTQRYLQKFILDDNKTPNTKNKKHRIFSHIIDDDILPAAKRLAIYSDAYRLRLLEILADDFPKLKIMMGETSFDKIALEYINLYPSKFYSVRYFGQKFPEFIKNHAIYSQKTYFAEMAIFEWELGNSIDSNDAPLLNLESLKTVPPEKWGKIRLIFHPSLQILKLFWNVPQLWQSLEIKQSNVEQPNNLDLPNKNNIDVSKNSTAATWIICRKDLQSLYRSATINEACILEMMFNGKRFAQICDKLSELMPEDQVPMFALECLQVWIRDGFISNLLYT